MPGPCLGLGKKTQKWAFFRNAKIGIRTAKIGTPGFAPKNGGFALYKWWIHANVLLVLAKKLTIKWDLSDHVGVLTTKNWMIVV